MKFSISIVSCLIALVGCGGAMTAPAELQNARAELVRVKSGPAAQMDPAAIHNADLALGRAEEAFKDDPDAPNTRELSIIALLKAQTANANANGMLARQNKTQVLKEVQEVQGEQLKDAKGNLNAARGTLAQTRDDLDRQTEATHAERKRRLDAEHQLKNARDTLARIAAVKDDDRGMVVTFQGEALFKTGQAQLLPAAMIKLDQVAETLRGKERKIAVVGHTDNQGGAGKYNQDLSEKRAKAVHDYLVSKGIPADLVRSEGKGPTAPVAENASIEGRAANRRVEIVVEPK